MRLSLFTLVFVLVALGLMTQKGPTAVPGHTFTPKVHVSRDFPLEWLVVDIPESIHEPYVIRFMGQIVPDTDWGVSHTSRQEVHGQVISKGVSKRYTIFHLGLPIFSALWQVEY